MNNYIDALKNYFEEYLLYYEDPSIHNILDFLWRTYTEINPIYSSEMKDGFSTLEDIFDLLPFEKQDLLFHAVCGLCLEHEKLAFTQGIHVGAKIMSELCTVL